MKYKLRIAFTLLAVAVYGIANTVAQKFTAVGVASSTALQLKDTNESYIAAATGATAYQYIPIVCGILFALAIIGIWVKPAKEGVKALTSVE